MINKGIKYKLETNKLNIKKANKFDTNNKEI